MSKFKHVNVLKVDPGQKENGNTIKTPFSKNMSEWTKKDLIQNSEVSLTENEHTSGFKMRTYQTTNVIVTETNWELEQTGPNEFTPKQP